MKDQPINKENNYGLGQLHPREAGLIYMIRNAYRFGIVEISTADGLPKHFRRREYTEIVPDGIPEIDPVQHIKEVYDFMEKISNLQ